MHKAISPVCSRRHRPWAFQPAGGPEARGGRAQRSPLGPAAAQGARAVGGLLPGAGPGGLGLGSRLSPRWCCVQGPRFCARHLRGGSCTVAFLCLMDDLLHPLAVIFRAVPAVPLYLSLQMLVQVQTPQKARVPACLQGSEFHSIKEADERRGCRGCRVQRRPHREGVAKQSPESSPVWGAGGGGAAKQRGPRGAMPGVQACREVGSQAGLQGGGQGNQDPSGRPSIVEL